MARTKQATPLRRETSSEYFSKNDALKRTVSGESPKPSNGVTTKGVPPAVASPPPKQEPAAAFQVLVATGGIYMSFLTWAYLQEKLTTTPYGPTDAPEVFRYPVFLNTIQSLFAAATGFLYLYWSTARAPRAAVGD
ncbi:hypothetical protein BN1723_000546 [Verticillium longisporum]|uniref:UDP-galactose transporter homolog 1 n=1 Tax=Verticillium longisporum TaxID=100787 RepID=A0A0G4M5R9_VERLO|nr:hypothetical protein BN1723_000546 [Verticillium longisporum]